MRSILITACDRPRYLYVTLSSLYRMKGIKDWETALIVDQSKIPEKTKEVLDISRPFSLNRIYIANANRGNLDSLVCGLSFEFSRGAEEVIFIEDDFLLRSDLLEYLDSVDREEFLISFTGRAKRSVIHYRPRGNLITKESFPELCQWVMSRKYVGEERPGTGQILNMDAFSHDTVFSAFVVKHGKLVSFADQFYVGDFGIVGLNSPEIKSTEKTMEIQSRMFSGPQDSWMDNVIRLMAVQAHKKFWPANFVYK